MTWLRDQSGARGLQIDSSETGDSEMTHLIPMDKLLDSAVYIFPPSNLKSSHDIGSRGSCLAALPVCVREREGAAIRDNRMWSRNTEEKAEFY